MCVLSVPSRGAGSGDMGLIEPLMKLVFHILGRLQHIRLSREVILQCLATRFLLCAHSWSVFQEAMFVEFLQGKEKVRKNRLRMQELLQKAAHSQRAEAAQLRKEEKKRAEKERIMNETDPEKQRRLEVNVRGNLLSFLAHPKQPEYISHVVFSSSQEKSNKKDMKKKQPKMKTMKVKMS